MKLQSLTVTGKSIALTGSVIDGGSVQIIDYKFGRPSSEYEAQVRNYARLYREMGYSDVKSSLWYVRQGRIVDVE